MQGDACVSGLEFPKGSIKNVNDLQRCVRSGSVETWRSLLRVWVGGTSLSRYGVHRDREVSPTGFSNE